MNHQTQSTFYFLTRVLDWLQWVAALLWECRLRTRLATGAGPSLTLVISENVGLRFILYWTKNYLR